MNYTIQKLAILAGVSVRTLHYYDEINLLSPMRNSQNSYRLYGENELLKLQQILFYRELGFALEEIKRILNSPDFDILQALNDHKKLVNMEIKRLKNLQLTIDKTIKKMNGDKNIEDKELYGEFTKEEVEKYKKEAREKWGNYEDRTKGWSREKFNETFEESKQITLEIVEKMKAGLKPSDPEVQKVMEKHFALMNKFWDCNVEAYKNLGQMYVDDGRFTKNIDKAAEGLAAYMRDAMAEYAARSM